MQIAATAFSQQAGADISYPQKPRIVLLRERLRTAAYTSDAEHLFSSDTLILEQELADRGDLDAIQRIAFRQLLGLGVAPNVNEAVRAFEGAAQAGDPGAMLNLGLLHSQGINGVSNHTRARELFLAASEADLPAAWNGLGHLYLNGLGVKANATLATYAPADYQGRCQDARASTAHTPA
jgi:TPR repeat protein